MKTYNKEGWIEFSKELRKCQTSNYQDLHNMIKQILEKTIGQITPLTERYNQTKSTTLGRITKRTSTTIGRKTKRKSTTSGRRTKRKSTNSGRRTKRKEGSSAKHAKMNNHGQAQGVH